MEALDRLFKRVRTLVGIGRTTTPPNDGGAIQTVQIKLDDLRTRDQTKIMYHFGFTACLPVGSDVVLLTVAGDLSNGVTVATAHQPTRPTGLQPGEVKLYDAFGKYVYLKDGEIIVEAAESPVFVNDATTVTINASSDVTFNVGGNVFVNGAKAVNVVAPNDITLTTPVVLMTGDLHVEGEIWELWGTPNEVRLGAHIHPQGPDSHGDTEQNTGPPLTGIP